MQHAEFPIHAARQEIANLFSRMQNEGVIQCSECPWASPEVLVRKRDSSLRFCVDYRALNSVTKATLPRIDDLFDDLGKAKAKFFTTLDLAAVY